MVLQHGEVRNSKQLEHLADVLQAVDQKLRFTLNPVLCFLFYGRGKERDHFCWELLNSNASYLWSFSKCVDETAILEQISALETEIGHIRDVGREQYRRKARAQVDMNGMVFTAIRHNKVQVAPELAFDTWRANLEKCL